MRQHFWIPLLGLAFLPGLAQADDWKDENGHGRTLHLARWGDRVPGYWGGYYGHYHDHSPGYWREPVRPWGGYYAPPAYWDEDDYEDWREDYEDRLEERRERLEDLREERRERYEDWRKDRKKHLKELRKRQRKAYKRWR